MKVRRLFGIICFGLLTFVVAGCGFSSSSSAPAQREVAATVRTVAHASTTLGTVARARPNTSRARPKAPRTLQLGSHGADVRSLQQALVRLTYLPQSAVDGNFGMRTWHAVVALQGWSGIDRDGTVGPRTRAALAHASRPTPWSTADGFEVHIPQQVLLLVRDGRVQRAIHISSGAEGRRTPLGHFAVYERDTMSWSRPFHVWMPLAQYFYGGYALHELSDVPAYAASHGCVRVPADEAQTVWQFGRIGLRVWTSA